MTAFPDNWFMYDEAGNLAVSAMMRKLKQQISSQPLPKVRCQLQEHMKQVEKQHGEVYDTEVREAISRRLTQWACEVHELDSRFGLSNDYWGLL